MYTINDVAEWFLNKEEMTQKKLQKLCYYAYAWYYTLKESLLFDDTNFKAWVHGPVSPKLYHEYKGSGWNVIKATKVPKFDSLTEELLESVWETYGDMTGNALEALTHSEPPWVLARGGLQPNELSQEVIDIKVMKAYYSSIYIGGEE